MRRRNTLRAMFELPAPAQAWREAGRKDHLILRLKKEGKYELET
jgi:hypothetical protein